MCVCVYAVARNMSVNDSNSNEQSHASLRNAVSLVSESMNVVVVDGDNNNNTVNIIRRLAVLFAHMLDNLPERTEDPLNGHLFALHRGNFVSALTSAIAEYVQAVNIANRMKY